jgi:intein/homing endonuclease
MLLAHELAGFSLVEADELRKLLMKPVTSMSDDMKKKRIMAGEKFINGCIKNKLSEKNANDLWENRILPFISYGFVKSLHFDELVTIYDDKDGKNKKQVAMKDVQNGMFVRSRNEKLKQSEFVQVKEKHDHGIIEVYEIVFDDGRKVKCTLDHKFRVDDGRMLPVWKIMKENLNVVALDVEN